MRNIIKRKEEGFLLIEVTAAIVLLLLLITGMMKESIFYSQTNSQLAIKSSAGVAAQYVLDDLRYDVVSSLPQSGYEDFNKTVDGHDFVVRVTYCTNATYCDPTYSRHLSAQVLYDGNTYYEMETVYTDI